MSISFAKNREAIIAAWKDVLDDKSTTDWSLFGYEGQTNELKVVGSGEGGIEELREDLNSGKIMYAFLRIVDPKTGLKKFLLINWQGEGAPVLRKGTCANHIHDVAKLLAGAHLTINARTEDDMDPDLLIKKLSVVSSAYSFKEPRGLPDEQKTPIGTNYNRVIPAKELNPAETQNFWKKEEEEERHRIELEKERKREEVLKLEEEQRRREEKEHNNREKQIINNAKLQPAHIPIKTSPQPLSPEKTLSPTRTLTEAERMRQLRSQEARELIGSRVGTAKAMFTQNTSEGQLQSKISTAPPAKPARTSIAQRINALNNPIQESVVSPPIKKDVSPDKIVNNPVAAVIREEEEPVKPEIVNNANEDPQPIVEDFVENEEQFSTIKRSPHNKTNSLQSPDETIIASSKQAEPIVVQTEQTPVVAKSNGNASLEQIVDEDDFISLDDNGLKAKALYDYEAADESEITFDPGDIITHIDQIDEGWWQGLGPDGTYGLFPANYVELLN